MTALSPGVYSLQSVIGPFWIAAPGMGSSLYCSVFAYERVAQLINILWTDDGSVAQVDTSRYDPVVNLITRWRISEAGGGNYTYVLLSLLVLTLFPFSFLLFLQISMKQNIANTLLRIESEKFPGRVIDLEYANNADNTRAILYQNGLQPNQLWQFIPVAI